MAAAGIGSLVPLTTAVIEAKRSSAPASKIDKDLERLATVKAANPGVRTFLFLVSESTRPRRFVSENGCAIRGKQLVPSSAICHYRVRRACKATSSFRRTASAHYACIVEVFNGR